MSHIPVHQLGATAVNLVAGEKPADVYSGIAARVLDIMRKDAQKDPEVFPDALRARLLINQMVTTRLSEKDVKEKGWLLDGYPRSFDQAQSLEKLKIRPDIYVVLDVPDEILINRCVGRRLDPIIGKIYHIKNFPPETEEIKARLIMRPDDTEEKIDGNRPKEVIFKDIDSLLSQVQKEKEKTTKLGNLERDSY